MESRIDQVLDALGICEEVLYTITTPKGRVIARHLSCGIAHHVVTRKKGRIAINQCSGQPEILRTIGDIIRDEKLEAARLRRLQKRSINGKQD